MFKKNTNEIDARSQPNCIIMGLNIMPKEKRAPAWKNSRQKQAARMYQP
jgi:hypothetical protein